KSVGRTGVETAAAAAAAIGVKRLVQRQREVGKDRSDKKEGADPGIYQHAVLADPAQSGSLAQLALRNRPRVGIYSSQCSALLLQKFGQLIESLAGDPVIIPSPGILRHPRGPAFFVLFRDLVIVQNHH